MPGPWFEAAPPKLPGAYTNFEAVRRAVPGASNVGVCCIPFTHDWGPFEEVVDIESLGHFQSIYGASTDTPGYKAILQAFKGEARSEGQRNGAGRVVGYRFGGSAANKANRTLQNTTPAAALKLLAKYEGSRGNDIKVEVSANTENPSTHHDFVVYDGLLELERYTYLKAEVDDLVDQLAFSEWIDVDASLPTIDNVALATTAAGGVSLQNGNDGSTLTSGDWADVLDAVEPHRFAVFCPFDLADDTILATVKSWLADPTVGLNSNGQRVMGVFGGTLAGDSSPDSMTNALDRADDMNNENIVVTGGYIVSDNEILDVNNEAIELTASQFAPRVAGLVARFGATREPTFGRLGDVNVVTGPTDAEKLAALEGGVLTIGKDNHAQAPVRLELGVTTYQDDTEEKPLAIYGNIKFVQAMHKIEMDITDYAEQQVIGRLPVNDATRELVVGRMITFFNRYVDRNMIQPGFKIYIAQNPPPTDFDDFISIVYDVTLARGLRQIRNTVVVR